MFGHKRSEHRHQNIYIMNIQRALIASSYPFQPTSALKTICAGEGVSVEHDVSNSAICCSLDHTAIN